MGTVGGDVIIRRGEGSSGSTGRLSILGGSSAGEISHGGDVSIGGGSSATDGKGGAVSVAGGYP